jgi:hypothetical protein
LDTLCKIARTPLWLPISQPSMPFTGAEGSYSGYCILLNSRRRALIVQQLLENWVNLVALLGRDSSNFSWGNLTNNERDN